MKRLLFTLLFCFASSVFAAPFIVSDPDPTGASDKCVYQEGTAAAVETPVAAVPPSTVVGSCKIDTAAFTVGSHNIQLWFKSTLWGVTSVKTPFGFQKPSASGIGPTNLQLVP